MDTHLLTMNVAAAGMRAQSLRMRVATENLANADSLGYQRKMITFNAQYQRAGDVDTVKVLPMRNDSRTAARKVYDPSNPAADGQGYVSLSNVNPLLEMTDAREAQRSYEASLNMFDQARSLYERTVGMINK